ncbi:hypothetical protein [Dickeya oryzae]|uniref:Uncharacterized protein n=1 Tax=Dickeya oryzae TaxID=1240404 RepID=A0AB39ILY5_9GAMM|nr:hypothetical protein [Dickeya oryzae]MCA6993556.1 hypothetical protein [Dickeya oryzae]
MANHHEPVKERNALSQRVIAALRNEFTEDELNQLGFPEAMWLAMQVICGPGGAAQVIRLSQIHQ